MLKSADCILEFVKYFTNQQIENHKILSLKYIVVKYRYIYTSSDEIYN